MDSVCVLMVTYNRVNTLLKTIDGLKKQDYPISGLFIFNNNSTDSTEQTLKDKGLLDQEEYSTEQLYSLERPDFKFYYFKSEKNLGGAGGFSKGIEMVAQLNFDLVWIMDDDVLPEPNCLDLLIAQMNKTNVGVAIPNRSDKNFDDKACINFDFKDYRKFWTEMRKTKIEIPMDKEYLFICDMPFEGPLVRRKLLEKVGIPDDGFFIEYDDSDYAQRLQKFSRMIMVPRAILHRQLAKKKSNKKHQSVPYNWRNYYKIRNNIMFDKRYGENWKVRQLSPIILLAHHLVISVRDHNIKTNVPIVLKAFIDGIFEKKGKRVNPNY
ncbi:glycosyltransferase family 2 protein [Limosilactobacillus ingluviei]|uniref:glycosyltransferase family 2 protein n=1 Tax=Limosilactobacillus ingluviei TaxID=148604 RepID=UPI0024B92B29|nr:glycosyltransferase family 2 protein [Limosilactobacillus ingluviei]